MPKNKINNSNLSKKYWDDVRQTFILFPKVYSPERNLEKFEKYFLDRRGLLYAGYSLHLNTIQQIASGLKEMGLKNIEICLRYAKVALEVKDFGQYNGSNESINYAKSCIYKVMQSCNWILTGKKDMENLSNYIFYLLREVDPLLKAKKHTNEDKNLILWGCIVPLILEDNIDMAYEIFSFLFPGIFEKQDEIEMLPSDDKCTIFSILKYKKSPNQENRIIAEKKVEKFYNKITSWGDKREKYPLWKELTIDEHYQFARIRAENFTMETDPILIIESIRGF